MNNTAKVNEFDAYVLDAYAAYRTTMERHGVPYPAFFELTRSRQLAWKDAIASVRRFQKCPACQRYHFDDAKDA